MKTFKAVKTDLGAGMFVKLDELERTVLMLRELGLSYKETAKLMSEFTQDLKGLMSLWGKPGSPERKGSSLIKLGVGLIAFPIPTIGIKKSLGTFLIAAGLLRQKMEHINVTDVYTTFKDISVELEKTRKEVERMTS